MAVSPERTLWLFSDTWVGKVRDGRRTDATLVNNTVAVQEGHGDRGQAALRRLSCAASDGKLAAPSLRPTVAAGSGSRPRARVPKLYLFLAQIERNGDGVFGFRQAAQWLASSPTLLDEPERWRIEQKRIPHTDFWGNRRLSFGAAILRDGDHLYLYGTDEIQGGPGLAE